MSPTSCITTSTAGPPFHQLLNPPPSPPPSAHRSFKLHLRRCSVNLPAPQSNQHPKLHLSIIRSDLICASLHHRFLRSEIPSHDAVGENPHRKIFRPVLRALDLEDEKLDVAGSAPVKECRISDYVEGEQKYGQCLDDALLQQVLWSDSSISDAPGFSRGEWRHHGRQ